MKDRKARQIFYPLFLNIKDKKCVIVGGGEVSYRKIKGILNCGAKIIVISPEFNKKILRIAKDKPIKLIKRRYRKTDINGASIVIAATGNKELNKRISEDSKKVGALVNVVDDIRRSDFISPSFFRRGNLTIAISTGGKSPIIAKKIRERIEESFSDEYKILINLVGDIRSQLKKEGINISTKRWESAIDIDSLLDFLKRGEYKEARDSLIKALKR